MIQNIGFSSFPNNGICSNSPNNDLTNNQIIEDSSVSSSSKNGNIINSEYEMNESVNESSGSTFETFTQQCKSKPNQKKNS